MVPESLEENKKLSRPIWLAKNTCRGDRLTSSWQISRVLNSVSTLPRTEFRLKRDFVAVLGAELRPACQTLGHVIFFCLSSHLSAWVIMGFHRSSNSEVDRKKRKKKNVRRACTDVAVGRKWVKYQFWGKYHFKRKSISHSAWQALTAIGIYYTHVPCKWFVTSARKFDAMNIYLLIDGGMLVLLTHGTGEVTASIKCLLNLSNYVAGLTHLLTTYCRRAVAFRLDAFWLL